MSSEDFTSDLPVEEEAAPIGCPYKKFKFDRDEQFSDAQFVTTVEDRMNMHSNGGDLGIQHQEMDLSILDVSESVEDENGSENGEKFAKTWVPGFPPSRCTMSVGGSDYENGSESEENDEDIETMLDQALPEELKNKKKDYEERFKIIMEGE